jgi:predicted nuclease of predicted toxin-antitoxin system
MKFLVDAQLPRRLAVWLTASGHDALHTLDLPQANRTPDDEICRLADAEQRVVITKDDDFVYSFFVSSRPERLLLVSTGNIANAGLMALFEARLSMLIESCAGCPFVELTRTSILLHR